MHQWNGQWIYSPSDLNLFFQCPFSSWMNRYHLEFPGRVQKDKDDETLEILKKRGLSFEEKVLNELRESGKRIVTPKGESKEELAKNTIQALHEGADIIYQAYLVKPPFAGYADFLCKINHPSKLGDFSYEVWDTKLARHPKPYFLIQLSCYSEMLEEIQGSLPPEFQVILGTDERVRFHVKSVYGYYLYLKEAFLNQQEHFNPEQIPDPPLRIQGPWKEYGAAWFEAREHVALTATITQSQVNLLKKNGIETLGALAASSLSVVPERLKRQAKLQLQSKGKSKPEFELLMDDDRLGLAQLPPPDAGDVYFDLEGYPLLDQSLEYLFGLVYQEGEKWIFKDWWAHDSQQEKMAFEAVIDWIVDRRKHHPNMRVYHYGNYEKAALRRLMGRYATREDEVDQLLRDNVLVDLYSIVKQSLIVGDTGYSLKNIEKIYLPVKRAGDVTAAMDSVLMYRRWIDSPRDEEGESWKTSPILEGIRNYNRVDCESTGELVRWLRSLQEKFKIQFRENIRSNSEGDEEDSASPFESPERKQLKEELRTHSIQPLGQLIGHLLDFHRRENKPVFWRMFDRHQQTEEELIVDLDCLVGLRRTHKAPETFKKSLLYEYSFVPNPDSPIREGSKVIAAHDLRLRPEVIRKNDEAGLLYLKFGASVTAPQSLSLIPDEYVPSDSLAASLERFAAKLVGQSLTSEALPDFLLRKPPRVRGGSFRAEGSSVDEMWSVVRNLDQSVLCIQGPPGTGKTWSASHLIARCLGEGKTVGVTSLSHAAINNLLAEVINRVSEYKLQIQGAKIQSEKGEDLIFQTPVIRQFRSVSHVAPVIGKQYRLVGATAWPFCHPEMEGKLDYLFVDEAGQVPLANLIAMGPAASNFILMGDPAQLSQPIQGTHPGDSGRSALEYYLDTHATIPPDRGFFLERSFRMSPPLCKIVSELFYEDRLEPDPRTQNYRVDPGTNPWTQKSAGLAFVPCRHSGNQKASIEEAKLIKSMVDFYFPRVNGEIIVVAPYNLHVQLLRETLGDRVPIGTIDKFQGQEAQMVIVSLAASDSSEASRGLEFILNRNRMNVALSRGRAMAVLVANPDLIRAGCSSVRQMTLMSMFCSLTRSGSNQNS